MYVHVHAHSISWLGFIINSTRKHGYLLLEKKPQYASISMPSFCGIFSVTVLKKIITLLSSIKGRKVIKGFAFSRSLLKKTRPRQRLFSSSLWTRRQCLVWCPRTLCRSTTPTRTWPCMSGWSRSYSSRTQTWSSCSSPRYPS